MNVSTLDQLPRDMESRVARRAADKCAELFFGESWDDFASAILIRQENGAVLVTVATGRNAWDSLLNACAKDYAQASRLAEMDTRDGWQMIECLDGRVQMRAVEDSDGNAVAYLFKR